MGATLAANVMVLDAEHNAVLLKAGSEVPEWAADQVGDHCFAADAKSDDDGKAGKSRQRAAK